MRTLTVEAFKRLVQTEPIPFVIINYCDDQDAKIPFLPEDAKVVSVDEWDDELVPADGVGVVVRDHDKGCPFQKVEFARSIACFDIRTKPAETKYKFDIIPCEEVVGHAPEDVVVDLRREDEQEHFGTLPEALSKPLHGILHDYTHAVDLSKAFSNGEGKKMGKVDVFCRCNRRAKFCAQLLHDIGLEVRVAEKGAVGLSQIPEANMRPYRSYELGEDFPKASTRDCGCGIEPKEDDE